MNIGLYAFDKGPSNVLKLIEDAARSRGHETVMFPPLMQGVAASRAAEMFDCNVLVIGFSSFQTQEETGLIEAVLQQKPEIPVVVPEDVPGSSLRPKAKSFAPRVTAVLTPIDNEAIKEGIYRFGYKRVECLGPAPHWGPSYKQMISAGNVREKLRKRFPSDAFTMEFEEGDKIILVQGQKDPLVNNTILSVVRTAGLGLLGEKHLVLGFRKHPGEKPETPEEEEIFERAFVKRTKLLERVWMLEGECTLPEAIASADITIFHGGPNESIVGAYARQPIAYYYDAGVRRYLINNGFGDTWFVPEVGGAFKIDEPNDVEGCIRTLLTSEGREELRTVQEEHFPLPETWDTAPLIVGFLETITR